jgi:hypothetical protein
LLGPLHRRHFEKARLPWSDCSYLPASHIHIFQVLGVLLFGVLKRAKKYQRRDDELPAQVDHVLRLFRAYEQTTTITMVRASWMRTGFQYEERADTRDVTVNEAVIRSSPGFQEIWQFDYVMDRLSARRQSQKCGWINQHLFRKKDSAPQALTSNN